MIKDIECPYCKKWLDIDHDDGYGYEENETYMQTCEHCNKTFTYTTAILYVYEAEKAPCQNGEPHKLKRIWGSPKELFEYKRRCEWCGKEVIIDSEAHKRSVELYLDKLNK